MRNVMIGGLVSMTCALALGCGALGGLGVPGLGEQKDYVGDAQKHVSTLKSDYVLMMGVYDLVEQKLDEFMYVPDGLKLAQVKWKDFQEDLTGCWNAPMEAVENAQQDAVDAMEAAKAYKNQSALREVKAVQVTGMNAFNRVKQCPAMLADEVKGFPKKGMDEGKAWARDRLKILNEIRVLIKDDLPSRATAVGKRAAEVPLKFAGIVKEAEAFGLSVQKIGTPEQKQKHQQQMDQLNAMKADLDALQGDVQRDATGMPGRLGDTGTRVVTNFTTVGRKK